MTADYDVEREARRITDPIGEPSDRTGSGLRNVYWDRRRDRWRAVVAVHGKRHELGYFRTPERAAREVAEFRRYAADRYRDEAYGRDT